MTPSPLFDFSSPTPDPPDAWRTVDDPVMGGVSESKFVVGKDHAVFTGTVSLDHGGGFASVRAPERTYDLGDHEGVRLRLRGDDKHYWFTAYTEPGGSLSYRTSLAPPTTWTTLEVPFHTLTPYRRGTKVSDAPSFAPAQVRTMGFLIADEQSGPFRLEVAWIRAGLSSSA
mgnify:CR=1 FL=1